MRRTKPADDMTAGGGAAGTEVDTIRYCVAVLLAVVLGCWVVTSAALARQSRRTR